LGEPRLLKTRVEEEEEEEEEETQRREGVEVLDC